MRQVLAEPPSGAVKIGYSRVKLYYHQRYGVQYHTVHSSLLHHVWCRVSTVEVLRTYSVLTLSSVLGQRGSFAWL